MKFIHWVLEHIAEICMIFGLFSGIFVFVSWAVGYYANGLFNYHFDLASCWTGLNSLGVGMVGLLKWLIDSSPWNTLKGFMPGQNKGDVKHD